MLEVGGGLDLGQEPLGAEDGAELGAQDLQRHLAVVAHVLRELQLNYVMELEEDRKKGGASLPA